MVLIVSEIRLDRVCMCRLVGGGEGGDADYCFAFAAWVVAAVVGCMGYRGEY